MTTTLNFSWTLPTINADAGTWGTELNGNWSALDTTLYAIQTTANAALPKAGGTLTGPLLGTTGNFSGAMTAGGFSGPLTGNVTGSASGNAGTATALQTARTLSYTGDATGSGSFDGSGNLAIGLTLANTAVTAGSYGDSTHFATFTVDGKGRITGATGYAVPSPSSATTGAQGIIRLATQAEVTTGTDATIAVSPATLTGLAKSRASPGYERLPSGLIVQWGTTGSLAPDNYSIITFPLTFPNACLMFQHSPQLVNAYASNSDSWSVLTNAGFSTTTATVYCAASANSAPIYVNWFALGY